MKKLFKMVLVLSMFIIILTGCEFNKEEEKGTIVGNEEKYADKILTDQEALAIGKELYDKAIWFKRSYKGAKYSPGGPRNEKGECTGECFSYITNFDEYLDTIFTKEFKESIIASDDNLSRIEDGQVIKKDMLGRVNGDFTIFDRAFKVKRKKSEEIEFTITQRDCADDNYSVLNGIPETCNDIRNTDFDYIIVKQNDLWLIKEGPINFKSSYYNNELMVSK